MKLEFEINVRVTGLELRLKFWLGLGLGLVRPRIAFIICMLACKLAQPFTNARIYGLLVGNKARTEV